jgi:molybdopterin/thiamine biosynthesis adenylyltransferase/rhodanese-related sulfurtransferase
MPATNRDLLAAAKAEIREVEPDEVRDSRPGAVILDVREQDEWDNGHLPGAVHVPRGFLEFRIEGSVPDRDTPVVVYCQAGSRSAYAAKTLGDLGYTAVESMRGGIAAWKERGFDLETPRAMTPEQKARYSRHLLIPEVGEAGQHRLLDAKVLLLGAGGLGSPAALYLAAAGVGTIGIVDSDVVDASNLQRQIIHSTDRLGQPKTASAAETIRALNPDVRVVEHRERLDLTNAEEILTGYDLIVDGTDNFPTRYLVNDLSVLHRIPVVHGSIFRFDGQLTVFHPLEGPCYRCLYPEPPPPELAPSCAEAGVLGVLPGIVGTLQAAEALKIVLGIGEPLVGRLLMLDALDASTSTLRLRRDPACPACGENGDPRALLESPVSEYCLVAPPTPAPAAT